MKFVVTVVASVVCCCWFDWMLCCVPFDPVLANLTCKREFNLNVASLSNEGHDDTQKTGS